MSINNDAPSIVKAITAHNVKLPKALTAAVDAHRAALGFGTTPTVDAPGEALTVAAGDVGDLIERVARERALGAAVPEARGEVADLLARRVHRELVAAAPDLLAQLAPEFTAAAHSFTEALAGLPGDLRPEALVAAGAGTVSRYEQATTANATLTDLSRIRNRLADIGVKAPGDPEIEQWTRVFDLEDHAAIANVRTLPRQHFGSLATAISATGVRGLWWPTLDEQADAIARVTATRPRREPKPDPTIRGRQPRPLSRA